MNWQSLIQIRKLTREEIQKSIKDPKWQVIRVSMKGKTLKEKYDILERWYKASINKEASEIQIINYINALKRGGLIRSKN
jgi:hypothetical protein